MAQTTPARSFGLGTSLFSTAYSLSVNRFKVQLDIVLKCDLQDTDHPAPTTMNVPILALNGWRVAWFWRRYPNIWKQRRRLFSPKTHEKPTRSSSSDSVNEYNIWLKSLHKWGNIKTQSSSKFENSLFFRYYWPSSSSESSPRISVFIEEGIEKKRFTNCLRLS